MEGIKASSLDCSVSVDLSKAFDFKVRMSLVKSFTIFVIILISQLFSVEGGHFFDQEDCGCGVERKLIESEER